MTIFSPIASSNLYSTDSSSFASAISFDASSTFLPVSSGTTTSSFFSAEMVTFTESPSAIFVPASGSCLTMSPGSYRLFTSSPASTISMPLSSARACACAKVFPVNSGVSILSVSPIPPNPPFIMNMAPTNTSAAMSAPTTIITILLLS